MIVYSSRTQLWYGLNHSTRVPHNEGMSRSATMWQIIYFWLWLQAVQDCCLFRRINSNASKRGSSHDVSVSVPWGSSWVCTSTTHGILLYFISFKNVLVFLTEEHLWLCCITFWIVSQCQRSSWNHLWMLTEVEMLINPRGHTWMLYWVFAMIHSRHCCDRCQPDLIYHFKSVSKQTWPVKHVELVDNAFFSFLL